METTTNDAPTFRGALGIIAHTAIDQAHGLAVAQLDEWSQRLQVGLGPSPTQLPPNPSLVRPLIMGALAGAAVAFLLSDRRRGT